MIEAFINAGHVDLDTALMYVEGKSEQLISRLPPKLLQKATVHSKGYPYMCNGKGLTADNVKAMCNTSLENLKMGQVDMYVC